MAFHKTSLKLAGFYLAILMIISLFFSASIYQVSVNELERGLRRPSPAFNRSVDEGFPDILRQQLIQERVDAYEEAQNRIMTRLILINLIILVGGGLLSYYLAVRTLRPIEEAHQALERFTADASHELRTPITAMRSEIEVALMDPKLSLKDAKLQLQSNVEELEKLTALSEGLLQLAHIDHNNLQLEAMNAAQMATDAVARVATQAKQRSVKLQLIKETNAFILAEKISATEALITLLDNAIKYAPSRSTVEITVAEKQKYIEFAVTDHGSGIAANELTHIFERFYRADSSRTKQGTDGYGLGLAIAKSIADAHGGSVKVSSSVGKGSTFTLSFPTTATPNE